MPKPGHRSKAMKRHEVRTPGNKNVVHYWRKKPQRSHCAICKAPLQAIPRLRSAKMKKIDKTSRRANRIESSRYCAKCLQNLIKESVYNQ